ncbi:MAG: PBP1A family penicillin-binding protein [Vicinamibacterales bacterium]
MTLLIACLSYAGAWMAWSAWAGARTEVGGAEVLHSLDSGPQASLIYDRDNKVIYSLFTEQRIDVPLTQMSPNLVQAALAAEDHRFYEHFGLDPIRMAGAAVANIKARDIVEGGSTITQQLARNLALGKQRTWARKFKEIILAAEIEAIHSKDRILETYLNTAYFGEGYYGVETAARGYFGKSAATLAPDEAALLAGLLRAPSANSPNKSPEGATAVRNTVLRAMRDHGVIDEASLQRYVAASLKVRPRRTNALTGHTHTPQTACGMYYFEEVRRQLVSMFGDDEVLEGGLRIFTAYDPDMQRAAERAVTQRLAELGGKGSSLQGALVAMEPKSGAVMALVGGRDFHQTSYNRATQAHRQPGSAFKPFVWAAAIERGWAPSTVLTGLDAPIGDGTWMPAGDHEAETYTLRRALMVSSNRAAAQLMQQVGLSSTIHTARRLGIESQLPAVPSLALGTGEVTLLEMVSAFGAFANEGVWTRPALISRVEDRAGNVLWSAPFDQRRAISTGAAYLMTSMLAGVVNSGTGYRARQMGFRLPAAGKTGTSDDYADAWFVGYTPNVVAGVWFGFDERRTIAKKHAGDIAVPAWALFMSAATRGDKAVWYDMPSDVEKVEICRASGHRAGDACRRSAGIARVMLTDGSIVEQAVPAGVVTELFTLGSAPYGECPVHSGLFADTQTVPLPADMYPPIPTTDPLLDPSLYNASQAVGTSGILGTMPPASGTSVTGTTIPGTPQPTLGSLAKPPAQPPAPPPGTPPPTSLGAVPKAGVPKLPGTPVKCPGGVKVERIAKPDGTIITVIKDCR